MDKYAILDIGSNSIKFFLFSIENGRSTTIVDTNNISRLGEGLQKTGKISDEAIDRNIPALSEFVGIAEKEKVKEIIAVGTMCLRTASNSEMFLNKVKEKLALNIRVISGEEEARLSYLAVLSTIGFTDKNIVVFDTGGGSTEFIFGNGNELKKRISLDIGAIYPTEKFLHSNPVTEVELQNLQDHIENFFADNDLKGQADILCGIGGTVTTMGAVKHKMVKYDPEMIQGSSLELDEINRQIRMFSAKTLEERKQVRGLQPKRADVILAGAVIVQAIMRTFKKDSIMICDRGLRHGILYNRFFRPKANV